MALGLALWPKRYMTTFRKLNAALEQNRSAIVLADNLEVLRALPDGCARLIYIDPPFNTGKRKVSNRIKVRRSESGERVGFGGHRYTVRRLKSIGFDDYVEDLFEFLEPRFVEARRVLTVDGSLFVHFDYREVHYCKVLLDEVFGRRCFQNEIIWAYDFGGRSRSRWSPKHDNILWYSRHPTKLVYNFDCIDRIPYMAPSLVGPEKAARGKTPTDVWWQTIVPTNGAERTGYPTQKPVRILERIVRVHSQPGDLVLDFFAGSGTAGAAAGGLQRRFCLVDSNPDAVKVMRKRLREFQPVCLGAPKRSRQQQEAG